MVHNINSIMYLYSERHAHTQRKKHTASFFLSLPLDCGNLRGLFMIYGKKAKRGAMHVLLRRSNPPKKTDKWRNSRKSSLPLPLWKKKQQLCDRLLPNVGVPKILLDRKFPILRRVLKSCSHPNAVTVILLTLIAFLHPRSLSFILSLCPSVIENAVRYLQCGPGLCWFTADNMSTSSWDCVSHWEVIADSEVYFSLFQCNGATI